MEKCVSLLAIVATLQLGAEAAKGPRYDPFPVRAAPYNPFDYTDLLEKLKDAGNFEDGEDESKLAHSLAWGHEVLNKISELTTVTDKQVQMAVLDGFWEEVEVYFGVPKKSLEKTVRNCHMMPIRKAKLEDFYKRLEVTSMACASDQLNEAQAINVKLQEVSGRMTALYNSKRGCLSKNFQDMIDDAQNGRTSRGRIRRLVPLLAPLLIFVLKEVAIQIAVVVISKLIELFFNWLSKFWKCVTTDDVNTMKTIQNEVQELAVEATKLIDTAWKSTQQCVRNVVRKPKSVRLTRLMDKCRNMVVYGSREAQVSDFFNSASNEF